MAEYHINKLVDYDSSSGESCSQEMIPITLTSSNLQYSDKENRLENSCNKSKMDLPLKLGVKNCEVRILRISPDERIAGRSKRPNSTNQDGKSKLKPPNKRIFSTSAAAAAEEMDQELLDIPEDVTPSKRIKTGAEWKRIQTDVLKKDVNETDSESEDDHVMKAIKCDKCPKLFPSVNSLEKHMSCHINKKVSEVDMGAIPLYRCSKCTEKFFHNAASMVVHLESFHTAKGESMLDCCFHMCFYMAKKDALIRHIRSKHTKEELFSCNLCPKKCYSYAAMKNHEMNHTINKQCKHCLRFFTQNKCHFCKSKLPNDSDRNDQQDKDYKQDDDDEEIGEVPRNDGNGQSTALVSVGTGANEVIEEIHRDEDIEEVPRNDDNVIRVTSLSITITRKTRK